MAKFSRGDSDLRIIVDAVRDICSREPEEQAQQGDISSESVADGSQVGFPGDTHPVTEETTTSVGPTDVKGEAPLKDLGRVITSIDELYDSIYSPELDFRVDQVEEPFESTFHWVFDIPIFTQWLQGGAGLFWIHGKPACGKSTLMKFISGNQQTRDLLHNMGTSPLEEIRASFFFHYRGTAIQKSFEGVLRILIVQILRPYRDKLSNHHRPVWETYQTIKSEQRRLWTRQERAQKNMQKVEREIEMTRQMMGRSEQDQSSHSHLEGLPIASKEPRAFLEELLKSGKTIRSEIKWLGKAMTTAEGDLRTFIKTSDSQGLGASPTLKLLTQAVEEFHGEDGLLLKLEKVIRLLMNQDVIRMDLALFFDALDEFGGPPDVICRFLKDLVQTSDTSATRVKVCFSSRPWESLKAHFSS